MEYDWEYVPFGFCPSENYTKELEETIDDVAEDNIIREEFFSTNAWKKLDFAQHFRNQCEGNIKSLHSDAKITQKIDVDEGLNFISDFDDDCLSSPVNWNKLRSMSELQKSTPEMSNFIHSTNEPSTSDIARENETKIPAFYRSNSRSNGANKKQKMF